jgi:hypothetical protein
LFALKQRLSANQDHSTNKEELSNKVLLNEFLLFSSHTGRTQIQDNSNVTENEINQHIGKSWKASASVSVVISFSSLHIKKKLFLFRIKNNIVPLKKKII